MFTRVEIKAYKRQFLRVELLCGHNIVKNSFKIRGKIEKDLFYLDSERQ